MTENKLKKAITSVYGYGINGSQDMKEIVVEDSLDEVTTFPQVRSFVKPYLMDVFDDGYYCTDNDDCTVNSYLDVVYENILQEMGFMREFLDVKKVLSRIPEKVMYFLSCSDGFYLAGGGALKAITDFTWDGGDYDIFYAATPSKEREIVKIINGLDGSSYHYTKNKKATYQNYQIVERETGLKIQFIPKNELKNGICNLLETFDITLCQFSISTVLPCLFGTDAAYRSLHAKTIDINPYAKIKDIESIRSRVEKYKNRGFTVTEETKNKIKSLFHSFSERPTHFNTEDIWDDGPADAPDMAEPGIAVAMPAAQNIEPIDNLL